MNIKEAKEQIKNAMRAYFSKDEFSNYIIPIDRQRPIFLIGAPGIGKTAIMEQIAHELGVGFVSYSMTHHTRQSSLGLPFIVTKKYGNTEFEVSEYTMSEIISSIYDIMEQSGVSEGILFLDEINCVSETLAPAMLQFLQFKIFGRHRVPDGWIVVTAGNPPEYNKSVREFDIATLDRLKKIDVEPDFDVWKEYAYKYGVHTSVLTYLEIKKSDFYKVETTVEGKSFVTARGWDDLSQMIKIYEKKGIEVDESLIIQYLQNKRIAKDFSVYYDLFSKYKSDYQIDEILSGKVSEAIVARAKSAKFDEKLSLIELINDSVIGELSPVVELENALNDMVCVLKTIGREIVKNGVDPISSLRSNIDIQKNKLESKIISGILSYESRRASQRMIGILEEFINNNGLHQKAGEEAFEVIKKDYQIRRNLLIERADSARMRMSNAFKFLENVYGTGQEILILVTKLTVNSCSARFISRFGCEEYFKYNKDLLFYDRKKELLLEVEKLDLE